MPTTIKYSDNPNEETAFVTQDGGQKNRAVLTAAINGTIEYPDNPNSTKVMVTVDGVKHRAIAVADISGGGSDQHNLGWYATQSALEEAHPTAEAGDWAIVGATDTVWIWDTDNEEWVDSDQKGQVTSVNGQTGAVTLGINDVAPTQTGKSGYVLGTDGFVAGWVKPEIVQVSALPAASEDEVDNIYQFVGTTDANYTNGYFYKCVSDGQNPATYSWTQTDVQPSVDPLPSQSGNNGKFLTTNGTSASWANVDTLPSQTGNNGKFLTTDGTDASWATVNALQNTATGANGVGIVGTSSGANSVVLGGTTNDNGAGANVLIGYGAKANNWTASYAIGIGFSTKVGSEDAIAIGDSAESNAQRAVSIGHYAKATAKYAIQIGGTLATNSDANTFKVANANGNFEMMSADGTIPTDRFTATPVADGTYVPTLTISSGVATRTWGAAASAPVVPATMPTLAVADWSLNSVSGKYEQAVTVQGITSSNIILVAPAPANAAEWADSAVLCISQTTNSLTFQCDTVPSSALTANVVIIG